MATATRLANATRSAACNATVDLVDGGVIQIYDGAQPAAGGAVTTQNILVEHDLGTPAFGAAANGVATAEAIADETITASGTAAWFRVLTSGAAIAWDGSVGTADADMIVGSTTYTSGLQSQITSWTYTQPAGA